MADCYAVLRPEEYGTMALPLKERWMGLRNYQSKDFWAMVFARPMTILLLLPVADIPWVTPNLITVLGVIAKLAGILLVAFDHSFTGGLIGALLINLGLVLDNMDGTLARYRNNGSMIGYYVDKSVDIIGLAGMFIALAWRAFSQSGEPIDLLLPMVAFAGTSVTAYSKWIAARVEADANLRKGLEDGTLEEYARSRVDNNKSEAPPKRSAADWVRWFISAIASIRLFNEVDIYFFVLLALALDYVQLFTRYASGVYALGLVVGPLFFHFQLKALLKSRNMK